MQQFVITIIQNALNRYIKLDPNSLKRIKSLQGKHVTICLSPFKTHFQVGFTETEIKLMAGESEQTNIKIIGTPLQLMALAFTPKERHRFFAEDVSIEGNVVIANEVIQLFDQLDIDWEDEFARRLGDVPSYYMSDFFRRIKSLGEHVDESFTRNINEYLHEEINLLPDKNALETFYQEVDSLRMDVDRLEQRIQQIKNQMVYLD